MITNIFLSFFEISVSISLVVVVLLLLKSFLNKRYAAKWLYLIWIFIALRLLVPFSGSNGQSAIDMLLKIKNQIIFNTENVYTDASTEVITATRRVIVEIPEQMTTPIAMQSEKSNFSITLLDIVALIWMFGSLVLISMHLISYFLYKRQVMKKGTIIKDTRILYQMHKLKRELNIKCTIHVLEFSEADSPMIIGFLKPILVLPKTQYSSEELFFILKHELVHLKRGDVYLKLLFVAVNAVHWFNPLIWIMQKEAVVGMELSCDEKVTQGTDYTVRKAYTETLFSTLHKRCANKTALSTQFYGGTQIMKKRFKNILLGNRKKNGIFILIYSVILTISFGTLVGCSMTKDDTADVSDRSENDNQSIQIQFENNATTNTNILENTDVSVASENMAEKIISLPTMIEGEKVYLSGTLFEGEGYSIYLTDNGWYQYAPDAWLYTVGGQDVLDGQVQFWITHFEDKSLNQVKEELADDGYISEDSRIFKQENEVIYNVKLNEFKNDIWAVFYCYPIGTEEGWGTLLPLIADTFAKTSQD
ncbi:MAG: M56 family metallopeptidase [Lachnospiraceae bacterium]|nr:M56 family metallopeptidase [Lachnospiraceae bacterium]